MARQYKIQTPDGATMTVEGPEDATDDELIAFAQSQVSKAKPKYAKSPVAVRRPAASITPVAATDALSPGATRLKAAQDALGGSGGLKSLVMNGASFGLSDEVLGAANALSNIVTSPFTGDLNPGQAYRDARDLERGRIAQAQEESPVLGTLATIAGGFAGANPGAAIAAAPNALAAIRSGAKSGAAAGALGGFGTGTDAETSAAQGVLGGAFGGVLGAALPIAVGSLSNAARGASRFVGRGSDNLSRQVVGRALAADANTGASAGAQIDAAQTLGVPYMLADTGENARALFSSVGRQPGASRTIVRDAAIQRQEGQGGRIRGAIERDLGPVANTFDVSDQLLAQGRAAAAPLYDEAYANPVISTPLLDELLATPAGRQAIAKARTIAANERRDPNAMGFVLDEEGNVALSPTLNLNEDGSISQEATQLLGYTPQTLDYVKRGLDDVVEANRDPVTRRLNLDEAGRAVNAVRANFVQEVDRLNPAYAEARAAYAGPASARQALDQGQKALNFSDQELERAVRNLNDGDREQFALGYRSALAKSLETRVDGADKARAILGSPKKRQALSELFGGGDNLARFETTLGLEREANDTYRAVATGSQTAGRSADDVQTNDAGLNDSAFDAIVRGGQNGWSGALFNMLERARNVSRFGPGEAGDRVRQSVATLLSETDPAALRQALEEANAAVLRDQARQAALQGNSVVGAGLGAQGLSVVGGNAGAR